VTRYLLDAHVWLWLQAQPEHVPEPIRDELADEENEIMLSAASSWEIGIKYALGKLALPKPPKLYVPDRMQRSGTTGLAVEHAHSLAVADLPRFHGDPFDRLLVVQAQALELRLVTADEQITQYDVDVVYID
jgi:PIN domain nuclease of toxin-antitoxin system